MLPDEVLLSSEIIDLPPRVIYHCLNLTPDQQSCFLNMKACWTDIYAAITRYQLGQPIVIKSWDKKQKETILAYVDDLVSLYKYIQYGWDELSTHALSLGLPETPGKLFSILLQNRTIAVFMPAIEGYSFSPQVAYRNRQKKMKGEEVASMATPGQKYFMQLELEIDAILSRSTNRQVQKARKEYLAARGEIWRLLMKAANPAKKEIQGGQWIDGRWIPSRKGVRHHPNLPD